MVVSLGPEEVSTYTLSSDQGLLVDMYQDKPILGVENISAGGQQLSPPINTSGGFDAYQPIEKFPAHTMLVLQLQLREK